MTTTFNLSSDDIAIYQRSQLRLLIGDATENDGPRPGQRNYSDEELDALAVLEDGHLQRTAALVFETLAAEWSRYAGSYRLGPESEEMRQAAAFADRAQTLRGLYGYALEHLPPSGDGGAIVDWSTAYEDWVGHF